MYEINRKQIHDQRFRMFNNDLVGIFSFKLDDLSFETLNAKAIKIIGHSLANPQVSDIFFDDDDFERFMALLHRQGRVEGFRFRIKDNDVRSHASISCVMSENLVEGILSDTPIDIHSITDMFEPDHEINQLLQTTYKSIQTPAATIRQIARLIGSNPELYRIAEKAEQIESSVRLIDSLAKDLGVLATNNVQPVRFEALEFSDLLEEIINPLRISYPLINCSVEIRGTQPFCSDRERVKTILINIITNAFRFHRFRSTQQTVFVRADITDFSAIIQIEDNGTGIRESEIENIFKPVAHPDGEGKPQGLGLYVASKLLEKLKGKIDVVSRPGIGSCFTFSIPNKAKSLRAKVGQN